MLTLMVVLAVRLANQNTMPNHELSSTLKGNK